MGSPVRAPSSLSPRQLDNGPFAQATDVPIPLHPDGNDILVWEDAGGTTSPPTFALYDASEPNSTPKWQTAFANGEPTNGVGFFWFDDDVVFISVADADLNLEPTSLVRGVYMLDLESGEVLDRSTFGRCVGSVMPAIPGLGIRGQLIVDYLQYDETEGLCMPSTDASETMRFFPGGLDSDESIELDIPESFQWFTFTPHATDDGQLIALGTDIEMYLFDATTGQVVSTYEGDRIAISGDGNQLLINKLFEGYAQLIDRQPCLYRQLGRLGLCL